MNRRIKCFSFGCTKSELLLGPFCHTHFFERYNAMSDGERQLFRKQFAKALQFLPYAEGQVVLLLTGLGDGFQYDIEECCNIFEQDADQVLDWFTRATEQLRLPNRAKEVLLVFHSVETDANPERPSQVAAADPSLLNLSLADIELSVRATNCLESEGITTVRDLIGRNEEELLEIRNFGETTLKEIKHKLGERGLHFGMKRDEDSELA